MNIEIKNNKILYTYKWETEWKCVVCWEDKPKNQPYRCLNCYVQWYWDKKIKELINNKN